jgi:hypothetical protein
VVDAGGETVVGGGAVVVGGGGAVVVVGGVVVAAGFAAAEDGRAAAEPFACGAAAREAEPEPDPPVDPLAAGTGACTTVGGATVLCGFGLWPPLEGETSTFAAGGGAALRDLIDGK